MSSRATAARLVRHGAPLEITEVDLPDPAGSEVLVDLVYAGVNPVDHYNAQGSVAPDEALPRTLGSEAVGYLDGAAVLVRGHGLGARRDGVFAGAAVVPRAAVVPLPPDVELTAAACMGVAGLTAWRTVVELGCVTSEDRVLVLGASGGVGSMVCALAAARGARVFGQTGSAAKADFVRSTGAAEAVVCDAHTLEGAARDLAPTAVFDGLGGAFTAAALRVLAPYGRLVLYGTSAGRTAEIPLQHLYRSAQRILGYGGLREPEERARPALEAALGALQRGEMTVRVERVLQLREVNDAFGLVAARAVHGKVVLDLGNTA